MNNQLGRILIGTLLAIMLVFSIGMFWNLGLATQRVIEHQKDKQELVRVSLCGHTNNRDPIFADEAGTYYVIPWLDFVSEDEIVLIKLNGNMLLEVYISQEVPYGGNEITIR